MDPPEMYPTGNAAPMDSSFSTTESASEYFTDNTTTGSRTPRQSFDHHDTDAESQLYQDARSFADQSMVSLVPSTSTPSATGNQIDGRLAPPGAPASTSAPALSTSPSTQTVVAPPDNAIHDVSEPHSQSGERPPTAGIDAATLRAHEQDPLETAHQVSSSTKADVASSEMAQTIGKQAATQEPYNMVNSPDATIPSPTKQATATLPEEARPDTSLPGQAEREYAEDHQSTYRNLLGVGAASVPAASALPATETASPVDAAAANAAGARTTPLAHNESPSTTVDMNGTGRSSSNGDQAYNEKHNGDAGEKKGLFGHGGHNDDHKKEKKAKKEKKKSTKKENPEDNPELAHFTPEQKRIILDQVEMGNGNKTATYLDIYKFATKFELFLNFIGIIAAIVSGVVQPLMTLIFGNLTTAFTDFGTRLATGQDTSEAREYLFNEVDKDALYLVYIGIGMLVATYIYMASWIYTGETTTRRIREGYLRAVLRQNVGFFDQLGAGEVTTRITSDIHLIQEGISEKVPITFQFVSQFFAGFVVAFIRNWRMTLVLSSIVPAIAGTGAVMATFQAKYRTIMLSFVAEGGSLAEEAISSVRTSHAFGTQNKLTELYDVSNRKAQYYGKKTAYLTAAGLCLFFFIIYSAYALAFWWGATLIIRGQATSGEIITCFFAVLIGAFSLSQVAPNLQAVGYAVGAANKLLFTIWRIPPIDSASTEGDKLDRVEGAITMEHVDFYYPSRPSVKVLDNYSATFPSGKITALVGASGSGKSSVIGLIERFYNTVGGTVKLDGHDVTKMNVRWLRSQIGLVSQEPTLFASKIWENVAYGLINTPYEHESEEVKLKMVKSACELANAHDFITNLPEGYETNIGERGMLLSGGQKQRIAIARAIVSNPPILLLDEATSALDTQSEKLVQKALDQASTGRTTITIAHRLSTIKDADQIIVMSKGIILETGTHDQLLANPEGAYAALVRAQALKEEVEGEDGGTATEDDADALAQREAEEARQMATIKRTGTGRSEVSEILDKKADAEDGHKHKEHGVMYLLIRLVKEIPDAKWYYVVGAVWSIVLGMVYPVFAIVFGSILGVFSSTDFGYVRDRSDYYSGLLFAIACISALAIALQAYCFSWTSEYLSRILRLRIFGSILRQDIAFFDDDQNSTGALTSKISEQPQKVNSALGITLGVIIQNLVTLVGGIIVGLCYAWKLSLVGLACIPLTLSAGIVRLRVVNLKDEKVRKSHDVAAQTACEAAGAIRTVASLTREDDAVAIYSRALDGPMRVSNRIALVSNVFFSITQALSFPVIALIFWYGCRQIVDEGLSTKDFFTSLTAVIFGSIQAGNVFTFVPDVSSAKGAAAKIVKLFDREVEIDAENPEGDALVNAQGHVSFKNVHFRYPTRPSVRVLRGLNLTVKPGEFVALVGPSGCGKSTIIQLIERFYDPILGSVEIDRQNIQNLNVKSLRENISLVSQEPTLYDGSVRFNITLGATKEPTEEEIIEACKCANIYDFIQTLPNGFDTMVGGKGSQLSGGQKQRIAIARALIRNPKILLLDEATSALDSQSEKVVQAALDAAAKNRTTIAVAHRLSTIQNADHIFVLKDGKVAERGTHSELIHKGGIYAELVQQQALEKHH